MKFIICCDFATLKCTHKEFAKRLSEFTDYCYNYNNFLWEIEVNDLELIPFSDNICESVYLRLSEFAEESSFLKICKISESFGSELP